MLQAYVSSFQNGLIDFIIIIIHWKITDKYKNKKDPIYNSVLDISSIDKIFIADWVGACHESVGIDFSVFSYQYSVVIQEPYLTIGSYGSVN